MTLDMWLATAILAAAIILFITEWIRSDMVALGVVVALMVTGLLEVDEALAGFSNPAVLTIAALFVVGGAVFQTGLASMIATRILRVAGASDRRLIVVIMAAVAAMSGIMSDTGVVAVMLPAIVALAASAEINPSKLLIPLSYGALLGGAMTIIGTPPNIIVAELLTENNLPGFSFFSYTPVGFLILIVCITFMLTAGRRLLPDRTPEQTVQRAETPSELFELYQLPNNLFRVRVRSVSPLAGKSLREAAFREQFEVNIIEIQRPADPRTVASLGGQRIMLEAAEPEAIRRPDAEQTLAAGDILIVQGEGADVGRAAGFWNLAIQTSERVTEEEFIDHEVGIAEVLLRPRSALLGKTLADLRFGSTYKLTVLDIKRPGGDNDLSIKSEQLRMGDTLLVQGRWRDIFALKDKRHDFVVMGETEAIAMGAFRREEKAPIALLVLLVMVAILILDLMPLAQASMIAAGAVVLTGCLTMDEAYEAIEWRSLALIAGMLPLSAAMVKVGLVDSVAEEFISALADASPRVALAGIFLLTSALTQTLSNTATAVLIAPVALATAQGIGVQPQAFLMAVALAASMGFASPVASPVNTLVMGAGRYRFSDYVKIGAPMIFLAFGVSVIALPVFFPF